MTFNSLPSKKIFLSWVWAACVRAATVYFGNRSSRSSPAFIFVKLAEKRSSAATAALLVVEQPLCTPVIIKPAMLYATAVALHSSHRVKAKARPLQIPCND